MLEGNARFVAGAPRHPRQDVERRHELAAAQTPRAALFGCADSRLAAEIIFDQGLGDLFVVRNAGQVASGFRRREPRVRGRGARRAAHHRARARRVRRRARRDRLDRAREPRTPPHIWRLIAKIVPAARTVLRARRHRPARARRRRRRHRAPRNTIDDLLSSSRLIADAVAEGRLGIVGANYRLSEGTAVPHVTVGDRPTPPHHHNRKHRKRGRDR
jgi:carbonic anhydrase